MEVNRCSSSRKGLVFRRSFILALKPFEVLKKRCEAASSFGRNWFFVAKVFILALKPFWGRFSKTPWRCHRSHGRTRQVDKNFYCSSRIGFGRRFTKLGNSHWEESQSRCFLEKNKRGSATFPSLDMLRISSRKEPSQRDCLSPLFF